VLLNQGKLKELRMLVALLLAVVAVAACYFVGKWLEDTLLAGHKDINEKYHLGEDE
jgi:membrane protein DedA with SNARE-associated domain